MQRFDVVLSSCSLPKSQFLSQVSTLTINILVVDREGSVQTTLKETLIPLECQIITASSTALAIFLARKNFPSLIVLSLSANDDEVELPQEIANDPDLSHIPVVVYLPTDELVVAQKAKFPPNVRVLARPNDAKTIRGQLVPYLREFADEREKETTE